MNQRTLGIAGCAVGLVVGFSHSVSTGFLIVVFSLAVFNGARHGAWLSFDPSGDGGPGDAGSDSEGSDGSDGGGGGGGGDGGD